MIDIICEIILAIGMIGSFYFWHLEKSNADFYSIELNKLRKKQNILYFESVNRSSRRRKIQSVFFLKWYEVDGFISTVIRK